MSDWLAIAVLTPVPEPLNSVPSFVRDDDPPEVTIPNRNPFAPTALLSEPPEVVGLELPPLADIDKEPFMVQSP
jgi:hypothetical protein